MDYKKNNRLISGLVILSLLSFFYLFSLNFILIIFLFFLSLYDFNYSKICSLNNQIIVCIIFLMIFYFFNQFYIHISLFITSFTVLFFLTYIKKKIGSIFFIQIIIYLILLSKISLINSNFVYIIFFLSFCNDTFAYILGNIIKGPLITPNVSPNKTWSGTLSSMILSFFLSLYFDFSLIASFLISISFFFGDIYFSFIKRNLFIKDFSNLIPGHGGILDRIDSTFFIPVIISIFYLL